MKKTQKFIFFTFPLTTNTGGRLKDDLRIIDGVGLTHAMVYGSIRSPIGAM